MKNLFTLLLSLTIITSGLFAQGTVKRDTGVPGGAYTTMPTSWEESAILQPAGPCKIDKVQVYMTGAGQTDIVVAGDPFNGVIPPSSWIWGYNILASALNISSAPGWINLDVSSLNLRSDGFDGIVVQHRCTAGGPRFYIDNSGGQTPPYNSFYLNPDPQQYTLNLANSFYMARLLVIYDYPNGTTSQSAPASTLSDVAIQAGLKTSTGNRLKSTRVSVADWNNDGFDDVILGSAFFQNNGNGTFADVTAQFNILSNGCTWGDFNNDGFLDMYAANRGNPDKIYKNNGNGTFSDVTSATAISNIFPTATPIWLDYNNDGKTDLFISNGSFTRDTTTENYQDQLWRNNGNGTFANVTQACGIQLAEPDAYYDGTAATACDFNNDGLVDIFVANSGFAKDFLYRNNGDGTFTNVAQQASVHGIASVDTNYFGLGTGCAFGDLNDDGYGDLVVSNRGLWDWRGAYCNPSLLFMNNGAPNFDFAEKRKEKGLKFLEQNAGVVMADFDLDGTLDLWNCQYADTTAGAGYPTAQSRLYMNSGAPDYKLQDKTWFYGSIIHGAWTAAYLDFDNDGDQDLIAASMRDGVKLFRNDMAKNGNRPLGIRLKGSPANNVNMDAYGSTVHVYMSNGKHLTRQLMGGGTGTSASQNSNEMIFGLGNSGTIDSVVVKWPNATSRKFATLVPNGKYTLNYDGTITPVELRSFTAAVRGTDVTLAWETSTETNNAGFEVQKSYDAASFTKIGFVNGAGTTTDAKEYTYADVTESKAYYRLKQMDFDGTYKFSPVVEAIPGISKNFVVGQSYPNPFSAKTGVKYSVAIPTNVSITVHDVLGRTIRTLKDARHNAGSYEVFWDGNDALGQPVVSGNYFLTVRGDGDVVSRMMNLQR